ncbi:peptide deformylase [Kitasatospora sp. NPDC096077]|uniref:peptide deformylase n=1 Tax=Kitasatospora sp. NPDC096077 TaxID=3155544 RepID=UPI00332F3D69
METVGGTYRPITEIGTPVLHHHSADVTEFGTERLARLLADMFFTMHAANGVGLAANQIGLDLRLFVYDCPGDDGTRHIGHVLNPEVRLTGTEEITQPEGCLSVPGAVRHVTRAANATVRGQDWQGRPVTVHGTGLFARCLQHETDHTNGTLYVDRLTPEDRAEALRQMDADRATVLAQRATRARLLARQAGADQ